jgi:hypothetical protein
LPAYTRDKDKEEEKKISDHFLEEIDLGRGSSAHGQAANYKEADA